MNQSRRQFLKQLTMAGSALALVPVFARANDAAPAPQWVVVGPVTQFPKDVPTKATAGSQAVYITHADKDVYLALSAVCTHRGCEVNWRPNDKAYICPCHRGRFDTQGAVLAGPPPRPLPAYPTRVNTDGTLSVNIGGSAPA